jgi:cytochrome c oxidase assembly protein subunit 15
MSAGSGWAHRLALVTAGATLALIVAGGLVTTTGAALAVPDWPTTFGHNMFLFPWSGMVGGVLYEHSHRLLGALVGLLTLGLAGIIWGSERRGALRGLALAALALVCLQGLLGGLRVVLLREALAIIHGCLAQAFFGLVVALTVLSSRGWTAPAPCSPAEAGRTWWLSLAASGALSLQIVLGALTVHDRWPGWVTLHLAGAVIAGIATAGLVMHVLGRHAGRPALTRPAGALGLLLVVEVGLGLGAYVARFTGGAVPGGLPTTLALPVGHRAAAALLLGAALVLALQTGRARRAGRVPSPRPVRPGVASREVAA